MSAGNGNCWLCTNANSSCVNPLFISATILGAPHHGGPVMLIFELSQRTGQLLFLTSSLKLLTSSISLSYFSVRGSRVSDFFFACILLISLHFFYNIPNNFSHFSCLNFWNTEFLESFNIHYTIVLDSLSELILNYLTQ